MLLCVADQSRAALIKCLQYSMQLSRKTKQEKKGERLFWKQLFSPEVGREATVQT